MNTCFLLFLTVISEKGISLLICNLARTRWYIAAARLFRTRSSNCSYVSSANCSSSWSKIWINKSLMKWINGHWKRGGMSNLRVRLMGPFRSRRATELAVLVQTEHPVSGRPNHRKVPPFLLRDFPNSGFPKIGKKRKKKSLLNQNFLIFFNFSNFRQIYTKNWFFLKFGYKNWKVNKKLLYK